MNHGRGGRIGGVWVGVLASVLVCASAHAQYGLSMPPLQDPIRDAVEDVEQADDDRIQDPTVDAAEAARLRALGAGLSSIEEFVIEIDRSVSTENAPDNPGELLSLEVGVALVEGVWRAGDDAGGAALESLPINSLAARSDVFADSALRAIGRRVEDGLLEMETPLLGWVTVSRPARVTASPSLLGDDLVEIPPRIANLTILFESEAIDVDTFGIEFIPPEHPDLPAAEEIMALEVELGLHEGVYLRPSDRFESATITLGSLEPGSSFYTTGLATVVAAITDHLRTSEQLVGILVAVSPEQVSVEDRTYQDLRDDEDNHLDLRIYLSVVKQFRTLAFGDRVPEEDRENAPVHQRIVDRSPITPGGVLRRDVLDEYLHRLNRMSGRRVSAALSAADQEGVQVDYLISERRPFLLYGQVSNTGTEQTDRLRYRFGGQVSQLLNLDDTLTLDYINAGFDDETQGFLGQYESDVPGTDRLRYRIEGAYSEFVASDVGLAGENFVGDSTRIGAGLIWNVYQRGELFVDLLAGARWQNVNVNNEAVDTSGDSNFFIPRLGARLERRSRVAETTAFATVEFNLPDVAGTSDIEELEALGRIDIDDDFQVLRWGVSHSFYLEPVLNRKKWEDVSTPKSSTLAHEIKLGFSGQTSLGTRLIPQEEQVVGGLFTVRGYPESVVSGDNVFLVSAEYRFHLPRALDYSPSPGELFGQPFRWRPQEVYGEADWDLIFKAFVDAAWVDNQDRLEFETEDNLLGAGVGVEFSFRRNLFVRVDWGFALEALEEREQPVDEGDNEVHFVVTVLF